MGGCPLFGEIVMDCARCETIRRGTSAGRVSREAERPMPFWPFAGEVRQETATGPCWETPCVQGKGKAKQGEAGVARTEANAGE